MDDRTRRVYEMFIRVLEFMMVSATDFQTVSFVAATVAALKTESDNLAASASETLTTTAAAKDSTISRSDARDDLRHALEDFAETWKSLLDEVSGAENKFRLTHGNNPNLIALGKSFANEAEQLKTIFTEHGLPTEFIAVLRAKTQAVDRAQSTRSERVGTNAAFGEPLRKGKMLVGKLAPAVKRRYRDDSQKFAQWLIISHRAAKNKRNQTLIHRSHSFNLLSRASNY